MKLILLRKFPSLQYKDFEQQHPLMYMSGVSGEVFFH